MTEKIDRIPPKGGSSTAPPRCPKCDGCGQVADTQEQEPWSVWLQMPLQSSAAVLTGLVKPIPCPACEQRQVAEFQGLITLVGGTFPGFIPGLCEVCALIAESAQNRPRTRGGGPPDWQWIAEKIRAFAKGYR